MFRVVQARAPFRSIATLPDREGFLVYILGRCIAVSLRALKWHSDGSSLSRTKTLDGRIINGRLFVVDAELFERAKRIRSMVARYEIRIDMELDDRRPKGQVL